MIQTTISPSDLSVAMNSCIQGCHEREPCSYVFTRTRGPILCIQSSWLISECEMMPDQAREGGRYVSNSTSVILCLSDTQP